MGTMSARQVRSLIKRTSKRVSVAAAAGGPTGACIITRHAPRTKDICEQLSQSDCDHIDQALKDQQIGFTTFYAGRKCPS